MTRSTGADAGAVRAAGHRAHGGAVPPGGAVPARRRADRAARARRAALDAARSSASSTRPTSRRCGCRWRCAATASPRPTSCSTGWSTSCAARDASSTGCTALLTRRRCSSPPRSSRPTPGRGRSLTSAGTRRSGQQRAGRAAAEPADDPLIAELTDCADRPRCSWATSAPEYVAYHDDEWGTPLHGEQALFERLSLEAFQSGLSWLIILRKRPAFRAAFAGFDVDAVARFAERRRHRLLADAGIVRNRAKIEATIAQRRAVRAAVPEGLDALLWSFAPDARRPRIPSSGRRRPNPSRCRRNSSAAACASSARRPLTA